MKQARRLLALMMCLMIAGMPMAGVLAEAGENPSLEIAEPAPEPTAEPAPAPTEEPTAIPTEEPTAPPTEAPAEDAGLMPEATREPAAAATQEPTAVPAEEPTAAPAPQIDTTQSALASPEFHRGYAVLLGEAFAYDGPSASAKMAYRFESGVFFVLARDASAGADRLQAVFDGGEGELYAWVDAISLRPMSAEEIDAFVKGRAAAKGTRFYLNAAELPLDVPVYAPVVKPAVDAQPAPVIAASAMRLNADALNLGVGEAYTLIPSFADNQEHSVTYTTQDSGIATVSAAGKVTGKSVGATTVRVKSEQGEEYSVSVTVQKAPTSVSLKAPRTTLGAGESIDLAAAIPAGTASVLTFSTSNAKVATVDKNGKVYTMTAGTVTLGVKTFNGKAASVKLTVKAAPASVTLKEHELTMGEEQTYAQTAVLSSGSATTLTYSSSAPNVVAVDPVSGMLTAVSAGEAEVTVKTHNGKTDTCTVRVKPAPSALSIAQTEMKVGVGELTVLPKITLGAEGENCAAGLSYTTSNSKYVAVNQSGQIKGMKAGSAVITVKTHNGLSAQVKVTVMKAPSKVVLSLARKTLGVGESLELTTALTSGSASAQLRFVSGNENIARFETREGKTYVKAAAKGTVKIGVWTFNNKSSIVTLTVKDEPTSVTLKEHELTLGEEQTCAQTVTLSSGSAGGCSFKSSAPEIVKVDPASGKLTAVSKGDAVVTVETYNGWKDTCTVHVKAAPSSVSFAETAMTIGVGEIIWLPEVTLGAPGEDCAGSYSYATSNKKYVAVGQNGQIKGVKAGSATITVKTHNGKTAQVKVTVRKAPSKVALSLARKTLGVGESLEVKTSVTSGSASAQLRFVSANENIARFETREGKTYVKAVAKGTVKIGVFTYNNRSSIVTLTVKDEPTSVELGEHEFTLGEGQTCAQTVTLSSGSAGGCSFESSAPEIVKVDPTSGKLTAVSKGDAIVTVETYNGWKDTCTVHVKAAPSCVSFAQTAITVGAGEIVWLPKVTLGAPGEDCAGSYSYATSNKKYVVVGQNGQIKGVKAGSATITVKTHNGKAAQVRVTVRKAPSKVAVSAPWTTLGIGEDIQLKTAVTSGSASTLTFTSVNPEVATVDANGNVHAVAEGTATITVRTFNGKTASVKLAVKAEPTGVTISPAAVTLGVGESHTLTAALTDGGGGRSFSSDNSAIVAVDPQSGAIKGMGVGTTVIRVRTYNKLEAQCSVTVKAAPTGIAFQETSVTLSVGDSYQMLPPVVQGANAASNVIRYASSSTKYLKVDGSGKITGVKAGTVTLTTATYNGKKASIKVYVKAAPGSIAFGENARSMLVGETYVPQVKFANGVPGTYSLTSLNAGVVTVEEDGKTLRAVGGGSAIVTAKSFNNKTANMTINVIKLPDSITLQPSSLALGAGESAALTAVMPEGQGSTLTYSSSDDSVASVDAQGKVTAIKAGSAVITVRTQNKLESTCAVRVFSAPTGIKLEPEQAELEVGGDTLQLTATSLPDGIGAIRFASSNVKVAEVTAAGVVTPKSAGTCVITATTYDGKHSAQCTLRVTSKLPLAGVRIGIDPGHQAKSNSTQEASSPNGGTMKAKVSSGTTGVATKIQEYKTNLEIGLKLRDALVELGAEVVMTRETHNVNISNQERAALMNKKNVDLALRLHCNGSENQSVNGLEVYTRKTCAYESSVVDASALLANEKRAAEAIFAEVGTATGVKKRSIYYNDNYTMNNWCTVPCLLVEMGYMTNPDEDRKLNDSAYQDKIVEGLINGICVYMGRDKIY